MSKLIIYNATAGIKSIAKSYKGEVKGSVVLKPGNNEVDSNDWMHLQNHPGVKKWLDRGQIVLISVPATTAKEKEQTGNDAPNTDYALDDMPKKDAKEIILKTADVTLLKKWEKEETRAVISTCITSRIKELEEKLEDKGK